MTNHLFDILKSEGLSLLVNKEDKLYRYKSRGVADLYNIIKSESDILNEAIVADKIVGKGAIALMIKGGVKELITDTISLNALELAKDYNIKITHLQTTPHIINRAKDGWCPVEKLCKDDFDIEIIFKKIENFILSIKN
ncbi:MAG: DUF1893 domain-containing protein [Rikenellaceae bacterium]